MDEFYDGVVVEANDVEILFGCNGFIWVGVLSGVIVLCELEICCELSDVVDELCEFYGDEVFSV